MRHQQRVPGGTVFTEVRPSGDGTGWCRTERYVPDPEPLRVRAAQKARENAGKAGWLTVAALVAERVI